MVSHGHIMVDGERVNIPSYLVKPGQVVALKPATRQIPNMRDLLANAAYVPGWLKRQDGTGEVVREPQREEIDQDINEQLIIEFYSR